MIGSDLNFVVSDETRKKNEIFRIPEKLEL
jgi:hypothetical protein